MKNTENKIKNAFTQVTPDLLDSVIRDSGSTKGTVIYMKKQRRFPVAAISVAAALLLVLGGVLGAFALLGRNAVASVVSIDVNPAVEIKLNKNEEVVSVTAINEDGKIIIGNMELEGVSVDVALNALVGSMIKNGYIDELSNSVLVSVECEDKAKNDALRKKLMDVVNALISNESTAGSVITQKVDQSDEEAKRIAQEYGVSLGKAQIVAALCKENASYDAASLAKLNINELSLLITNNGTEVNGETIGNASDKKYINPSRAQTVALSYAKVTEEVVVGRIDVSLDFDDGIMVYEVDFRTEDTEYDIEINAVSGEVVSCETEEIFSVNSNPALEKDYVSPESVADTVLTFCPDKSKWSEYECEFDHEDGKLVYEVELKYEGIEHEFIINTVDGTVLRHKTDRHVNSGTDTDVSANGFVSESAALSAVLTRAELTEKDITDLKIELDHDDNVWKYEIEFRFGKYEYEAEVNADTGDIISYEKDIDD